LTHGNRGGSGSGLLGEKRDVKVWLGWLERFANNDVEAIETPIGYLPRYEDLKALFSSIDKDYPKSLYDMQFALYIDNIIHRIDLQTEAYGTEGNVPETLFAVYRKQKEELLELKKQHGSIVTVSNMS
ncbi:MAG: phosphoenolpyruvate carboxykinase domain-containing protein, partial [Desulfocapsaceae bacterium]|nr:phosphoenolpyruvate carboxykinase domain-containing protein [Desulfocapsaceae bacterium]